ncbi:MULTISPECIES: hypothetical protein [Dyadobacter]|jgi:3-hydroxymyristoyl/3-hydroxydecanoyl-(acyl carrier protein) dehydratase|uniref:LTXXQ motif family protein n=1 Tax=Dyadobacter chenhuakuii TaxID=2909339 RepID=A0A9X1QAV7_9BACT|nr:MULTISPECIES: hypothetical protein [Dyadobacter]MCF2494424.1 hypothetical protein [Dyadobacter chenhuakuii]MCF2497669.1 hypothetical protein [Dyadobacter chenhuakuii]MCF2517105.1 hypothetical protein [Dyadobacter sp. CY351]USJ32250.1 hypothetical protein NFI80_05795 [Dyadobacter chenhuakuii]
MRFFAIAIFAFFVGMHQAQAQNFKAELKKLDSEIKAAYKNKKLTELEYSKLQREQDVILAAIEKAQADDIVTPDEKNKIHSKIVRSKKRLAKYKTNREVY